VKEVAYLKEVSGNRNAVMVVRYRSAQKNNLMVLSVRWCIKPGPLNLLYDADSFGKIWSACGQQIHRKKN